jgi:hypothetical protein
VLDRLGSALRRVIRAAAHAPQDAARTAEDAAPARPHDDAAKVVPLGSLFTSENAFVVTMVEQLAHLATIGLPHRRSRPLTAAEVVLVLREAFWASLTVDEGRPTRVRLVVIEPDLGESALAFKEPVPYEAAQVSRLAPAVAPSGALAVSSATATIWGMLPGGVGSWLDVLTILISGPGVLHLDAGPLRAYAVISGGRATLTSGASLAHELRRRLRKSFPPEDIGETQAVWRECLALAALVRRVLDQGHGGTIIFVPSAEGMWAGSMEFGCRFAKTNTILRDAVRGEIVTEGKQSAAWMRVQQAELPDDVKLEVMSALPGRAPRDDGALAHVSCLAAVDGAVVITSDLNVIGFGAKLAVGEVPQVFKAGPEPGVQRMELIPIEKTGGTRHQSAVRFVGKHRDCVAVVVSHDRHISLVYWAESLEGVVLVRNAHWWA